MGSHYYRWRRIIQGMKLGESLIVATRRERDAASHACYRLGHAVMTRRHPKGFRVWPLVDTPKNHIPVGWYPDPPDTIPPTIISEASPGRFQRQAISLQGIDWYLIMMALDSEAEETTLETGTRMRVLASSIRSQLQTHILSDLCSDSLDSFGARSAD